MKEHSLKFLLLRAVAVLLVVIVVLSALRIAGVTGKNGDIPPETVEEMAKSRGIGPLAQRP